MTNIGNDFKNHQFSDYDINCAGLVLGVAQVVISILTLGVLILWIIS